MIVFSSILPTLSLISADNTHVIGLSKKWDEVQRQITNQCTSTETMWKPFLPSSSLLDYKHHGGNQERHSRDSWSYSGKQPAGEASGILLPLLHWECAIILHRYVVRQQLSGKQERPSVDHNLCLENHWLYIALFGGTLQLKLPQQANQHHERPFPPGTLPALWQTVQVQLITKGWTKRLLHQNHCHTIALTLINTNNSCTFTTRYMFTFFTFNFRTLRTPQVQDTQCNDINCILLNCILFYFIPLYCIVLIIRTFTITIQES